MLDLLGVAGIIVRFLPGFVTKNRGIKQYAQKHYRSIFTFQVEGMQDLLREKHI